MSMLGIVLLILSTSLWIVGVIGWMLCNQGHNDASRKANVVFLSAATLGAVTLVAAGFVSLLVYLITIAILYYLFS